MSFPLTVDYLKRRLGVPDDSPALDAECRDAITIARAILVNAIGPALVADPPSDSVIPIRTAW